MLRPGRDLNAPTSRPENEGCGEPALPPLLVAVIGSASTATRREQALFPRTVPLRPAAGWRHSYCLLRSWCHVPEVASTMRELPEHERSGRESNPRPVDQESIT